MSGVSSGEANGLLESVVTLIEDEEYLQALAACRAALEDDPSNGDALGLQIICLIYTGEMGEAEKLLKQAAESHPANLRVQQAIALNETAFNHFAEAEQLLRTCTSIEPDDALTWHWLAMAQEGKWELAAALASSQRAVELRPRNLRMCLQEIYLLISNERYPEAIEKAQASQVDHALSGEMRRALAYAHLRKGDPEKAFHAYQEAAALNEQDFEAYEGMKEALRHRVWLFRVLAAKGTKLSLIPPRRRVLIIPVFFVIVFVIAQVAQIYPVLLPLGWAAIIALWGTIFTMFIGRFLGTISLLFHPTGHRLLWPVEKAESIWGFALLATAAICGLGYFMGREAIGGFLALVLVFVIAAGTNLHSLPKVRFILAWTMGIFGTFIGLWLLFTNPQ